MNRVSAFCIIILVLICTALLQSYFYLSWDICWLLDCTQRLLNGGTYLHRFFESNPPLILFLYAIPTSLAASLHLSIILCTRLFILLTGIISLLTARAHIRVLFNPQQTATWLVVLSLVNFILPGYEFGQRSHLCIMLACPYLFYLSHRLQPQHPRTTTRLTLWTAALAAIGFAIKPSYVLVSLALWCYASGYHKLRFWRQDTILILSLWLIYLLTIVFITPDYITTILPLLLRFYTHNIHPGAIHLLLSPSGLALLLTGVTYYGLRQRSPILMDVLGLTSLLFYIDYLVSGFDWFYHLLPSVYFMSLLLTAGLFARPKPNQLHSGQLITGMSVCLPAWLLCCVYFSLHSNLVGISGHRSAQVFINKTTRLLRAHGHNRASVFISASVFPGSTVQTYCHSPNASRFSSLWMLSGLIYIKNHHPTPKQRKIIQHTEQFIRQAYAHDIKQHAPALVFINSGRYKTHLGDYRFNYLTFLKKNNDFKRQWRHYRQITHLPFCTVYQRTPTGTKQKKE